MKTVDYLNVGFDEVLNVDVVLVIPKRIDCGFSETQPRKVNEELRLSELTKIFECDYVDESFPVDGANYLHGWHEWHVGNQSMRGGRLLFFGKRPSHDCHAAETVYS